jgi:hypothetical protein
VNRAKGEILNGRNITYGAWRAWSWSLPAAPIEQLGSGELEVKRFLKARNPYLQFNNIGEVER